MSYESAGLCIYDVEDNVYLTTMDDIADELNELLFYRDAWNKCGEGTPDWKSIISDNLELDKVRQDNKRLTVEVERLKNELRLYDSVIDLK